MNALLSINVDVFTLLKRVDKWVPTRSSSYSTILNIIMCAFLHKSCNLSSTTTHWLWHLPKKCINHRYRPCTHRLQHLIQTMPSSWELKMRPTITPTSIEWIGNLCLTPVILGSILLFSSTGSDSAVTYATQLFDARLNRDKIRREHPTGDTSSAAWVVPWCRILYFRVELLRYIIILH